jgi:hypothetical protein
MLRIRDGPSTGHGELSPLSGVKVGRQVDDRPFSQNFRKILDVAVLPV